MNISKTATALIAGTTTIVALWLVMNRGGVIAWSALLLGSVLLTKIWLKPTRADLGLSAGLAALAVVIWIATFNYVINTWESGEVVELVMETNTGTHTTRVWVLEFDSDPVIYYDAPPAAATALLAGTPLQFTRGAEVSTRIPQTTEADALSEEEAKRIFEAMAAKYGEKVDAADIYYLMLGRSRDRVAVVASLAGS